MSPARRDEPDAEIAENSHSRTASYQILGIGMMRQIDG
jgi:hypothetical protein